VADALPHISSFAPYCDECPIHLAGISGSDDSLEWQPCQCRYHSTCSRCGWPIVDDAEHPTHDNLCAACALEGQHGNELHEGVSVGRPPANLHELPALVAALGLPPDVPVTFHLLFGIELDDDWGEYRVEWALIPDVAWRYAAANIVVSHPWRVQLPGWDSPQVILRWRQWRVDAPEFLERFYRRQGPRWTHESQVRAIGDLPSPRRVREFAQLLQGHKGPGRSRDDLNAWLQEDLRPEIAATITDGQDPDQRTLAVRLGLSLQGLQKRFGKLNQLRRESDRKPLSWKRLVADVQAALQR
jgi:hypothetical protein